MWFRNLILSCILSIGIANSLPLTATAYSYDNCRALSNEQGISYSGAWEMNVVGCVYSKAKGYYVARSGICNEKARYWTSKYPYRRGWEMARWITDRYTYCEVDGIGRYYYE